MSSLPKMIDEHAMKPTVLFDIDGTLAKIDHRRSLVTQEKPDWKAFNSLMGEDIPNIPIVKLYHTLWQSNDYQIILVTGRSEEFRKITETWLTWNEIPFGRILMRQISDGRSDDKVKADILKQLAEEKHDVLFVVDDRDKVVNMWRHHGITCLQCEYGDF